MDADDDDIMEISPPIHLFKKHKRAILYDMIDIHDDNDESDDLVIIGSSNKGKKKKTIEAINQDVSVLEDDDIDDLLIIGEKVDNSNKGKKTIEAPRNSKIQGSTRVGSSSLQEIKLDNIDSYSSRIEASAQYIPSNKKKKSTASKPPFSAKFKSAEKASHNIMKNFVCLEHFVPDIDFPLYFFEKCYNRMERPKNWAKKILKEWNILEKNLPDSIFVRVYESRMDVMRAAIIGPKGTPYHDGLLFFDLHFPEGPPQVYFHHRSGSFVMNPNLRSNGEVCLSLVADILKATKKESWVPRVSTVLQILVSIQGLLLTAHPYYTESAIYDMYKMDVPIKVGSDSWHYNEDVFIGSLWTMINTIIRPPKDFEDLVKEHFRDRSHDIISACKAHMEGARVGSLEENKSQDVDSGYKYHQYRFFEQFKNSLREPMEKLVKEFTRIWEM